MELGRSRKRYELGGQARGDQDADGGWQNGRKQGSVGMRAQPDIGLLKKDPFITGLFFWTKIVS